MSTMSKDLDVLSNDKLETNDTMSDSYKNLLLSTLAAYNLSHVCKPSIIYLQTHKNKLFNTLKNFIQHHDLIEIILSYNAQKYYIQKECHLKMTTPKSCLIIQLINQSLSYITQSLYFNISTKLSNSEIIRNLRIYCDNGDNKYTFYGNPESLNILNNSYFVLYANNKKQSVSYICQWKYDANNSPMIIILDCINHHKNHNNNLYNIGVPTDIFFIQNQFNAIAFISEKEDKMIDFKIGRYGSYRDIKYGLRASVRFIRQSTLSKDGKFFDDHSLYVTGTEVNMVNRFHTYGRNGVNLSKILLGDIMDKKHPIKFKKLIYVQKLDLNVNLFGKTLCFVIFIGKYQNSFHLFAAYEVLGTFESSIIAFIGMQCLDKEVEDDVLNDEYWGQMQIVHNKINNQWIVHIECDVAKNCKVCRWTIDSFLSYVIQENDIDPNNWILMNNCYDATIENQAIINYINREETIIKYNPSEVIHYIDFDALAARSCCSTIVISVCLIVSLFVNWCLNDIDFLYD